MLHAASPSLYIHEPSITAQLCHMLIFIPCPDSPSSSSSPHFSPSLPLSACLPVQHLLQGLAFHGLLSGDDWVQEGNQGKPLTLKWGTPLMGDFGSKTPHWPDLTFLETVLVLQDLPSVSASQDWACISLRRIQTQVFWGKNMCCEIGPVQTHLSALLYGGTQFCSLNSWLFSFLGVSLVTPVVMLVNV